MTRQREFSPADRYLYDFGTCSTRNGWAQIDTRQDAHYFGQWINPQRRQIFSYAEGDTCLTTCDNDAELLAEMQHIRDFHNEHDKFLGVDPGFNEQLRLDLIAAGLGDFFHPTEAIHA
jgi:hypothetical protein